MVIKALYNNLMLGIPKRKKKKKNIMEEEKKGEKEKRCGGRG